MNKKELIEKIKKSNDLSQDDKAALIHLINSNKKYGLVWEDKVEEVEELLRTKLPVLREVKERAIIQDYDKLKKEYIEQKDLSLLEDDEPLSLPDKIPNHILIEGDNLHALTALSYTHAGKIDVIYIDPPYNTGNKDFKYNDSFVDKEDLFRHSKWISFINKRLLIASKLLSKKGVIFISIDDNEVAQLKLLCDNIFNENNCLGLISVAKGTTTGQDAKKIGSSVDYILAYSKSDYELGRLELSDKDKNRFSKEDENGKYSTLQWRKTGNGDRKEDRPNLYYPIKAPDGKNIYPKHPSGYDSRWRGDLKRFKKLENLNMIEWVKKDNYYKPYVKYYLEGRGKAPSNLWNDIDGNKKATIEIKDIFGEKIFQNPKPTELIKKCLSLVSLEDVIILDFFAGSGTTLQAVMAMNDEDDINRTCILCTNNENNICEEVTYVRNKKVIEGYTKPNGEFVVGLKFNNLRYYKTEFVDREHTIKNKRELTRLSTELLCIKEDCYTEIYKLHPSLTPSKARFFEHDDFIMAVVYDETLIEELIEVIKNQEKKTKVYIFSNGQYPYTEEFEEVLDKVELCALPDAIYMAYQSVLPKKHKLITPSIESDVNIEEDDNNDDLLGE